MDPQPDPNDPAAIAAKYTAEEAARAGVSIRDGEIIMFVAFMHGRPFSIRTGRWMKEVDSRGFDAKPHEAGAILLPLTEWDWEYGKKYGFMFEMSGGGWMKIGYEGNQYLPARWWAHPDCAMEPGCDQRGRLKRLPRKWDLDKLVNTSLDQPAEYCSVCDDWFPATDWDVCEHIKWCPIHGYWSRPDEPCGHTEEEHENE